MTIEGVRVIKPAAVEMQFEFKRLLCGRSQKSFLLLRTLELLIHSRSHWLLLYYFHLHILLWTPLFYSTILLIQFYSIVRKIFSLLFDNDTLEIYFHDIAESIFIIYICNETD